MPHGPEIASGFAQDRPRMGVACLDVLGVQAESLRRDITGRLTTLQDELRANMTIQVGRVREVDRELPGHLAAFAEGAR